MGLMNHFAGAYAGKQILVTSREAYNFMRKHRATDQDLIVVKKHTINLDVDCFREQSSRGALHSSAGACREQPDNHRPRRGSRLPVAEAGKQEASAWCACRRE